MKRLLLFCLAAFLPALAQAGLRPPSPTTGFSVSSGTVTTLNVSTLTATTVVVATLTPTGIVGTTTNNNTSVGNYGEYISSVVAGMLSPSTGNYGDMATITLTAGDWNVTALASILDNGATMASNGAVIIGISQTSGNSSTGLVQGDSFVYILPSSAIQDVMTGSIPGYRISLAASTPIYAKMRAEYSVATPLWYGRLSARRVR